MVIHHRWSMPILVCVFILASLSMSGCLGSREWTYPPPPDRAVIQPLGARLVVLPLEDQRGMMVQEDYWKIAIPLVPYAVTAYDRPETIRHSERVDALRFDPPSDFAHAVADEIRNSGIFSSVTFHDGDPQSPPGDFVLRGRLHSTRWERTLSTYLLGPFGTLAWVAGLPMGIVTTDVVMDLQLTSVDDPSRVLWNFAMDFEGRMWDGVYYGPEETVFHYPQAVRDALLSTIVWSDLRDTLSTSVPH